MPFVHRVETTFFKHKMTNKITEQDNDLFKITHNKELDCFDLVFKKAKYDTSSELLGVASFIHQMGVHCSQDKLRIGAQVEVDSKIINKKPKIIV